MLKTEIANLALQHVGTSKQIANLDTDDSNEARVIRTQFNRSLEKLLEKHPWGFAQKVAKLELIEECPGDGSYAFSYRYPADCKIIQNIGAQGNIRDTEDYLEEREPFEEYAGSSETLIYTNLGQAWAKYTKLMDPDINFPTHFGEALSWKLAMNIAPSLITNNFSKVKRMFMDDAKSGIAEGIAADLNRKPRPDSSKSRFSRARM